MFKGRVSTLIGALVIGLLPTCTSACSISITSYDNRECLVKNIETSDGGALQQKVGKSNNGDLVMLLQTDHCGDLRVSKRGLSNHNMGKAVDEINEGERYVFTLDKDIVKDFK